MDKTTLFAIRSAFGDQIKENVPLSGYTSARIGGPADVLIIVRSAQDLAQSARKLWDLDIPFILFGGGSNVLVSDKGVRGVTVLNRARLVRFERKSETPSVYAESGATLNDIAQRSASHALSGLEWAASVPGSLGGAVYGNAGAFGGEMSQNIHSVDILDRENGFQNWSVDKMEYGYRTSCLKRIKREAVILGANLKLAHGDKDSIRKIMVENTDRRHKTQPPGASMGSMFKNPPGDKAGRLLEAAGLKGTRIGGAEISTVHANFFINTDKTLASDMKALLDLAQTAVWQKFGVRLESEIELIGEW